MADWRSCETNKFCCANAPSPQRSRAALNIVFFIFILLIIAGPIILTMVKPASN